MKIAIMQPYIFPYIGYFQLINAVDKFVILDDVNYINKGWINRNRILVNNVDFTFTIPLKEASQNKYIYQIDILYDSKWRDKLIKTIELSYKKAPFFSDAFPVIRDIILFKEQNISAYIYKQLQDINSYLGITTTIVKSSTEYNNNHLKAQDKIIDICLQECSKNYINPIGGVELYNRADFDNQKIQLNFLKSNAIQYRQFNDTFVPWLSIIDVLMFNSKIEVKSLLEKCEFI